MKPIKFKEQTGILLKLHDMSDEECESLPIHFTGDHYISCWKMNFKERIKALFFGKIWLYIYSKISQPPVGIVCDKTVFDPVKEENHD